MARSTSINNVHSCPMEEELVSIPNTPGALNKLPRRTETTINAMRIKAKTNRQVIDHDCNQDIQCQHIHDLTECPRTRIIRLRLLAHLKPEEHNDNNHILAINILKTQTIQQYQELQDYTVFYSRKYVQNSTAEIYRITSLKFMTM